jgi:magnesium chelatase accessory protein
LVRKPAHIAGALGMMSQWRLEPLMERLIWAQVPTLLLAADKDGAVPPSVSDQAAARMRKAEVRHLPGLGHLAHEEAEDGLTGIILPWLRPVLQPAIAESAPKIIGR